jgi:hypothetical protein
MNVNSCLDTILFLGVDLRCATKFEERGRLVVGDGEGMDGWVERKKGGWRMVGRRFGWVGLDWMGRYFCYRIL